MPDPSRGRSAVLDREAVDEFLFFGFLPRADLDEPLSLLREWTPRERFREPPVSERELVRQGAKALKSSVREMAARHDSNADQVVLLSGGLDSRAILGGLLECFDRSQVLAATFGVPGEQDHDFAAQVARATGVRHEVLNSFSVEWTTGCLVESIRARTVPLAFPFGQRYLSFHLHRRIGPSLPFWDGLCGGSASGALLPSSEDPDGAWDAALERWIERHRVRGAERLVKPTFEPLSPLPPSPWLPEDVLSYPDQLDFGLRQARYIATRRMRGYQIRTPYLTGTWLEFMLMLPLRLRRNQYLYLEILKEAYPQLSAMPTTALNGAPLTASRWRRVRQDASRKVLRQAGRYRSRLGALRLPSVAGSANEGVGRAMRDRPQIRHLVAENIHDLERRGLFSATEVTGLWQRHVSGEENNRRLLTVLVGLELNLKAAEMP